jgi:hypothetical protein
MSVSGAGSLVGPISSDSVEVIQEQLEGRLRELRAKIRADQTLLSSINTATIASDEERARVISNFTTTLISYKQHYPASYKPGQTVERVQQFTLRMQQNDPLEGGRQTDF